MRYTLLLFYLKDTLGPPSTGERRLQLLRFPALLSGFCRHYDEAILVGVVTEKTEEPSLVGLTRKARDERESGKKEEGGRRKMRKKKSYSYTCVCPYKTTS